MGQPLKFDILATQDTLLIAELDKCAARGVGGVMTLTEAQYNEEVKKKETGQSLLNSSNPSKRRQVLSALHLNVRPVAGGQINLPPTGSAVTGRHIPEPIEVPSPQSFGLPPLAKTSDVNKK